MVGPEVLDELGGESAHLAHGDRVGPALGAGVDHQHLLLDWLRLVLGLLEELVNRSPRSTGPGRPGRAPTETGERLDLAELGQFQLELAGDRLHRLGLRFAADAAHRVADVHRRPNARVEQVGLQEYLAVGNRDNICRDVRGDVARLSLDDRKRGERAGALRVRELGRPLQQARVQVEDVARVRLAARRAAQQKRNLAVCDRLLGKVVVDDERVLAVVAEPKLADTAARIRRQVLEGGRFGTRRPRRSSCTPSRRPSVRMRTMFAIVDAFWPMAT